MIFLAKTHLFHQQQGIGEMAQEALFLHIGTLLAALIYFRRDVRDLSLVLFRRHSGSLETRRVLSFLLLTTLISGVLGVALLAGLESLTAQFETSTRALTLIIGCCLIGTGVLALRSPKSGYRAAQDLKTSDTVILGLAQGFAALPGLSRSGLTVSALLLRKFDKAQALRLSFLMSIPIVLAGNIVKNLLDIHGLQFSAAGLAGLLSAFVFGMATIHLLLKVAERINFGYFVLLFAALTIASAFL